MEATATQQSIKRGSVCFLWVREQLPGPQRARKNHPTVADRKQIV